MRRGILACLAVVMVAACAGTPREPMAQRVTATPVPTATPAPTPSPQPEPAPPAPEPTATPIPAPAPAPVPPPVRAAPAAAPVTVQAAVPPQLGASPAAVEVSGGLGAWMDVYDYNDDPASILPAVRDMAAKGVRTLYLQTARFNSPGAFLYPRSVAAALEEAHRLGMRVVAWYIMDFQDNDRDVARSLEIVHYRSPNGSRFDGFCANIERTEVADPAERSRRTVDYSRRLKEGAGQMPLSAVVISPGSLAYNQARWPGFPWAELAGVYEVFMPMTYWTYRSPDPQTADARTREDMRETSRLTGRPVHVVGGVGDRADAAQVRAYVQAAAQEGSIGVSLYDYRTTAAEVWPELQAWPR